MLRQPLLTHPSKMGCIHSPGCPQAERADERRDGDRDGNYDEHMGTLEADVRRAEPLCRLRPPASVPLCTSLDSSSAGEGSDDSPVELCTPGEFRRAACRTLCGCNVVVPGSRHRVAVCSSRVRSRHSSRRRQMGDQMRAEQCRAGSVMPGEARERHRAAPPRSWRCRSSSSSSSRPSRAWRPRCRDR